MTESSVKGTPESAPSVIVTGGANGIGAAVVVRLRDAGLPVVVLDLVDAGSADPGAVGVVGSSADEVALAEAIDRAGTLGAGLGAFVACAGISRPGDSMTYGREDWEALVDVNLTAVFIGARMAAAAMPRGGSIVAISSVAAHLGLGGRAAYCASKAGVNGLVRSLAVEWAARGIRVNTVSPGYTATDLVARNIASGAIDESELMARIPAGRLASAQEVAEAVWFLVSPASMYVTGTDILVDGGMAALGLALASS